MMMLFFKQKHKKNTVFCPIAFIQLGEVCDSTMCKSLLSSEGSEKYRWLTTQRFDALIIFIIICMLGEYKIMHSKLQDKYTFILNL